MKIIEICNNAITKKWPWFWRRSSVEVLARSYLRAIEALDSAEKILRVYEKSHKEMCNCVRCSWLRNYSSKQKALKP